MTWLRTQTDVTTVYYNPCQTKTDVRWAHTTQSGIYGKVECKTWATTDTVCDWAYARLNKAVISASGNPGAQRKKTSCHELGHTVGVRHYTAGASPDGLTDSCLRCGAANGEAWNIRFGAHHINSHINPHFP